MLSIDRRKWEINTTGLPFSFAFHSNAQIIQILRFEFLYEIIESFFGKFSIAEFLE